MVMFDTFCGTGGFLVELIITHPPYETLRELSTDFLQP